MIMTRFGRVSRMPNSSVYPDAPRWAKKFSDTHPPSFPFLYCRALHHLSCKDCTDPNLPSTATRKAANFDRWQSYANSGRQFHEQEYESYPSGKAVEGNVWNASPFGHPTPHLVTTPPHSVAALHEELSRSTDCCGMLGKAIGI